MNQISEKAQQTLESLSHDEALSTYIDAKYQIPPAYVGTGAIKLILLGQDPTIQSEAGRANIKTVLNLDKPKGNLWRYLADICQKLGIDLSQNVYATNLYKNFFTEPPTQIKKLDIFRAFLDAWLPLLVEELSPFAKVPVITLGEPVLKSLLKLDPPKRLTEYWGYTSAWQTGQFGPFGYIKPEENLLNRMIFPFPHQPSLRKRFYKDQINNYLTFVRNKAFSN